MITVKETKGKYIFWDIDGTLAAYRYNEHVGDPDGTENGMSIEEIEDGIFLHRKHSKFMQKVVGQCQAKKNIILKKKKKRKWMIKTFGLTNIFQILQKDF